MHHVAFVGIYDFNVFNNKLVINIWLLLFSIPRSLMIFVVVTLEICYKYWLIYTIFRWTPFWTFYVNTKRALVKYWLKVGAIASPLIGGGGMIYKKWTF